MNQNNNVPYIHKFKPNYFHEYGIEDEIVKTLQLFVSMDNLNLLLTGDAASGKTTLLNTIVKEYYKDYTWKQYESNVLFINNLKDQGINYYRTDVKTFCQTCSSIKNKKKIIVLDDIDNINEQSQQVFRSFIEKFSKHVHFISSCTNMQKVIESLQSRLNIIKIKPIQKEKLANILATVKKSEHILLDEDAEAFVLNISNNTVKTLLNCMEKFKLFGEKITLEVAQQLCSNISFLIFDEYTQAVKTKNLEKAIQIIFDLYDKGYSVMDILDNYFLYVKITPMFTEDEKYKIIPYICKYITVFHTIHENEMELVLFTNNISSINNDE
jgi:DNA polymerase III delta prime subunit